jgi:hypothetical protein
MADLYSLQVIGQANRGGALIPVKSGAMTLSGMATVVARSDNPFPFGRHPDGTPMYPPRYEGFFRRFYPFLENCQYRVCRLREYAAAPITPESLRSRSPSPTWLDRAPYRVLLAEGDQLVGVHYDDGPYVLIVRNREVMAGIREDAISDVSWFARKEDVLPLGVPDAGHCDSEVVAFERMMERDPSLQRNARQEACDYAGRTHTRATEEGRAKAGALLKKLEPIWRRFDRGTDRRL